MVSCDYNYQNAFRLQSLLCRFVSRTSDFSQKKNTDNNSLPQSVLVLVSCKCPTGIYNQPSASKNTRHAPWIYATQGSRSIVHSSTDIPPETSVVQTDVLEQVLMKETQDKRSRMLMVNLQQQTNK